MGQTTLRLLLGDQLNREHSWFSEKDEKVHYVFMEMRQETDYVRHHIQKVIAFFLAMRDFAKELREAGHQVYYLKLDDSENKQSLEENLSHFFQKLHIQKFEYQLPDEYRLDRQLSAFCESLDIPCEAFDTEHFLTERMEVEELFAGKKTYLMETFYRKMRKKYDLLMEPDGETPLTGKWNYDEENRKKLPKSVEIPAGPDFRRDVSEMVELLENAGVQTMGRVEVEAFNWPVNRKEGLDMLEDFLENRLPLFGKYQDAMTVRDPFLFHARISFLLNAKILHPLEVVRRTEAWWREHREEIDIAQVEGFIRQVIGWREYMRGIYWAKMPDYAELNYFNHQAGLPDFYWTGKTEMRCLSEAINQSLDHAYAHHIQRLMVTGNFALLLGCRPDEVDAWYLGIYIDAIEWVEITNTRGMSQFADGGIVGTKPYAASANYMHKMSDYCSNCKYDRKKKHGPDACPFNSLYWDFYARHADKLQNNPRIGMMYRVWNRYDEAEQEAILQQAAEYKSLFAPSDDSKSSDG